MTATMGLLAAGVTPAAAANEPTLTALSPTSGSATGGDQVTITGTKFTAGSGTPTVTFGGVAATNVIVDSPTQVRATSPAGSGIVDVVLTTSNGPTPTSAASKYSYVPQVGSLAPTSGPASGGTSVVISGTGFTGATFVKFGGVDATSYVVDNANQITAVAPAGTGTVDVRVTTAGGTSPIVASDQYSYVPVVTGVSPNIGPSGGGTNVTITGMGFTGATDVSFGQNNSATNVVVVNDTTITATSPAWNGVRTGVTVLVTTPGGTSGYDAAARFTYVPPPSVSTVSPKVGPTAGGNLVTVTGFNFVAPASATFGGVPATSVTVVTPNKMTMIAPAGAPGVVDIVITTPYGTSPVVPADRYTYSNLPTISSVSPNTGPTSGGNSVTISGTGFTGTTKVQFGTTSVGVGDYTVVNDTTITVTNVPARPAGTISVYVTNPRGRSASTAGSAYTYA